MLGRKSGLGPPEECPPPGFDPGEAGPGCGLGAEPGEDAVAEADDPPLFDEGCGAADGKFLSTDGGVGAAGRSRCDDASALGVSRRGP